MAAQQQYNGIILLLSYIQRIYIAETIQERISSTHTQARQQTAKGYFDELNLMLPLFEETKELTATQQKRLEDITDNVKQMMRGYFYSGTASFEEKLEIVGSSLYGEQLMNTGILRLGQVFNKDVGQDFAKRVTFYEERTQFIDAVVHTVHNKEEVEQNLREIIEKWYEGIVQNESFIIKDLDKIEGFLAK